MNFLLVLKQKLLVKMFGALMRAAFRVRTWVLRPISPEWYQTIAEETGKRWLPPGASNEKYGLEVLRAQPSLTPYYEFQQQHPLDFDLPSDHIASPGEELEGGNIRDLTGREWYLWLYAWLIVGYGYVDPYYTRDPEWYPEYEPESIYWKYLDMMQDLQTIVDWLNAGGAFDSCTKDIRSKLEDFRFLLHDTVLDGTSDHYYDGTNLCRVTHRYQFLCDDGTLMRFATSSREHAWEKYVRELRENANVLACILAEILNLFQYGPPWRVMMVVDYARRQQLLIGQSVVHPYPFWLPPGVVGRMP